MKLTTLSLCCALVTAGVTPVAQAALPLSVDNQPVPSLAPMLETTTPAVVNISTRSKVKTRNNPLMQDPVFRQFFGDQLPQQRRSSESLGSGVIVDAAKGYILTNHHVIDDADQILVKLRDGRSLEAKVIGSDADSDVAVIQVKAERLSALKLADSSQLRVGDFVVAIGNPFGLGQTVTSGIVSALSRTGLGIEKYEDFIQTDASINPGNSGGALVNLKGELVGINTAILGPNGGNIGIGFAIPANMVKQLMDQILTHGKVRRGLLGVYGQNITPDLADALDLKRATGVLINEVMPDSAAKEAGLQANDIVIAINDRPVSSMSELATQIGVSGADAKIRLKIWRDGSEKELEAQLKDDSSNSLAAQDIHEQLDGASLGNTDNDKGVQITDIANGSPAEYLGLRKGDIILALNRQQIRNLRDLQQLLKNKPGKLALNIRRGNSLFYLTLK